MLTRNRGALAALLFFTTLFFTHGEGGDISGNPPMKEYNRIVVLSPGAVETLYLLGGESKIAAIATSRGGIWPEEKTALLPSVGGVAQPSLETIISYRPDLVILNGMNTQLGLSLEGYGIPVYLHDASSVEEILQAADDLGTFSGRAAEAKTLITEKRERMALLSEELGKNPLNLKGAFLYSYQPIMGFTADTLPGELLSLLGVENIAANLNMSQPILSPEFVVKENPDFLFCAMSISQTEDLTGNNPFLAATRAGRENNIAIIPSSMFLRPSPRIIDSLFELREILEEIG
ncbi:MAG: ABC transporter substrate-binding protein [Spirochaetales bacterium]|nr:ABC transporter substrate-binding protein [Spirochaetales bacterium]